MKSVILKKQRCSRMFHGKRCKCKGQGHMLPDEMWVEIFSRLPIKSLLITGAVSSSWNIMSSIARFKIKHLPQCGLLLWFSDSYLCLRTKNMTSLASNSQGQLIITSGYDKGCLGDLSFNFGALLKISPWNGNSADTSFRLISVSRGLILIGLDDGNRHEVHNPATMETFVVPPSRMVLNYPLKPDRSLIIRGFEAHGYTGFLVVRFFHRRKWVEYYSSRGGRWFQFKSGLDKDLRAARYWFLKHYVALLINRRIMIFFLTSMNRGVAIKFTVHSASTVCSFRLPPDIIEGGINARLGVCDGCLYLSHLSEGGCLSIWKLNYDDGLMEADVVWNLFHRIDITRQFRAVNAAGDCVANLGFQENALLVYLIIKSRIVSYDPSNGTINQLCDQECNMTSLANRRFVHASPFTPFLGPLVSPNMKSF